MAANSRGGFADVVHVAVQRGDTELPSEDPQDLDPNLDLVTEAFVMPPVVHDMPEA